MKVEIGQTLWIAPRNYRGNATNPEEATVTKVGRKYFTAGHQEFHIENGRERNVSNYAAYAQETLQGILDSREASDLRTIIIKKVPYGLPKELDKLRMIAELLT